MTPHQNGSWRSAILILLAILLTGCEVFVPRQVEFYDEECQIVTRKLELESIGIYGVTISCHNEGCLIPLIPAAASAIVSGSIVVVGNVIYWFEKQGRCHRQAPPGEYGRHTEGAGIRPPAREKIPPTLSSAIF